MAMGLLLMACGQVEGNSPPSRAPGEQDRRLGPEARRVLDEAAQRRSGNRAWEAYERTRDQQRRVNDYRRRGFPVDD